MSLSEAAIDIRPVQTTAEARACEDLQVWAWQMPDYREVVPLHLLIAAQKSGGVLLAAFDGDRQIGFVFGILARGEAGRLYHYSHMLAVDPGYQGRGVGRLLKLAQRQAALAQGLDLITWTYDPLEVRNAYLNIHKLGTICRTYFRDLYGTLADGLNAGLPSDRFEVEWWLAGERVTRRLAGSPTAAPAATEPAAWACVAAGEAGGLPRPGRLNLDAGAETVGVEVPGDYQAVRAADPRLALAWRLATRQVFETYFAAGYAVTGFVPGPRAHYILQRLASEGAGEPACR